MPEKTDRCRREQIGAGENRSVPEKTDQYRRKQIGAGRNKSSAEDRLR
ncbi:MAG: hypothetical protein GX940_00585 [Clostridiaceae bacterium]|nr:hypothetical protein [Clostridiaceae bacterium]